jgi:hypothetical protein
MTGTTFFQTDKDVTSQTVCLAYRSKKCHENYFSCRSSVGTLMPLSCYTNDGTLSVAFHPPQVSASIKAKNPPPPARLSI